LFVLKTACELYRYYESKITACDEQLALELAQLPDRVDPQLRPLPAKAKSKKVDTALREGLYRKLGVDLTAIESVGATVALTVLTEVGPDLSAFPTEKHFCSWLGLCPDHRISGGKILSRRTRRVVNRLSDALRLAATTLEKSASAMGAHYRRMKARLGAAAAVTATAHKLARIIYRMLNHGEEYVRQGIEEYEQKYHQRKLESLTRRAAALGFKLVEQQTLTPTVS
jgi:transposase